MKHYDDLQRFREKSGKQHHAFKDLSTNPLPPTRVTGRSSTSSRPPMKMPGWRWAGMWPLLFHNLLISSASLQKHK